MVENGPEEIGLSGRVRDAFERLHRFMYDTVYLAPVSKDQESKAMTMVETLYNHFLRNPDRLPEEYQGILRKEGPERAVCDYISGMTDTYAIYVFEDLYVPSLYVPPKGVGKL